MKHKRRALLLIATAWPFVAIAQKPRKIYRIGFLSTRFGGEPWLVAFRERLAELGYAEGKNLVIEWRYSQGVGDRFPGFAKELARLNVGCIVASGVSATRAAMQATKTIPIVMTTVDADPVAAGLVASLARPGGNVTGFTGIAYDLAGKRLELLKDLIPKATRVAILMDPAAGAASEGHLKGTEAAARKLGMQLQVLAPRRVEELASVFEAARSARAEVLTVVMISWLNPYGARTVQLAAEAKLPAIYSNASLADSGALLSYSDDVVHRHREVAAYVAKILAGTSPSDLPVQQPTKFQMVVNLKTAKALGITIPQSIMVRADRVIQ